MRPFRIDVPQSDLDDLRARISATRWPQESPDPGWARGVPLDYLRGLADYWLRDYDWRAAERRLNGFPQFMTEIDGVDVHFLHVRSPVESAMPLVLTHGWPGSVAEFLEVVGPLSDPAAHGGDPADAFHVVVPSLPGYGFSGPVREIGWDVPRVARAWAELMRRLGYDRYVAQGGDWGSVVSLCVGEADPEHTVGVHVNMLVTFPPADTSAVSGLDAADLARLDFAAGFEQDGMGWQRIQSTRPQTLAYALTDSPVGQLAWIVEKFKEWTDSDTAPEDAVDRDHMLTNATIYWLTATAGSSAQLYYESTHGSEAFVRTWGGPWKLSAPLGVAVFPADAALPVRRFAERTLPTISRWTEFDSGGHFAAMECPEALVSDIRAFVRPLR
ncbi:epoxide hydrolase family protein [Nocardiopsis sp. LOL_012]|uniref:epoxide hydrolase family protein n=1 Tax=Nocardiopsis sp. LOL_012 TaxID=3345409 RepID=UPI003A88C816